jgi:hypothetical protein
LGKRQAIDHHNAFDNKPIRFPPRTTQKLKGKSEAPCRQDGLPGEEVSSILCPPDPTDPASTGRSTFRSRISHMARIKITPYASEDDMGDIFCPFHGIDTDVFPFLKGLFKSGRIRIVPDVNSRHPVLDLSK